MPTSSQSRILSVVDYQLLRKQQQSDTYDGPAKPSVRVPVHQSPAILSRRRAYKEDRGSSVESRNNERNRTPSPPPPSSILEERPNSEKSSDGELGEKWICLDCCLTRSSNSLPARLRSAHRTQRHFRYIYRQQQQPQQKFPYIRRGRAKSLRSARSLARLSLLFSLSDLTSRQRKDSFFSDWTPLLSSLGFPSARASQRQDLLHMPIININDMTRSEHRTPTGTVISAHDYPPTVRQTRTAPAYERTKSTFVDSSRESLGIRRNSFSSDHDGSVERGHRLKQMRKYPTPTGTEENNTSVSDVENMHVNNTEDDLHREPEVNDPPETRERRASLLNENARRLMTLGTIRPSKTFYKNLPEADVNHLMKYFRRMKTTSQRVTSEEINQELANKHVEYKPKICELWNFCLFLEN